MLALYQSISLWALGVVLGFLWVVPKAREWMDPEQVKRRDRIHERRVVPFLALTLILLWWIFWDKLVTLQHGHQFFVAVTVGTLGWLIVVLVQLGQPLPELAGSPVQDHGRQDAEVKRLEPNVFAIDGSNISSLYGFDPAIATSVARALSSGGHTVRVFFDANVGFRSSDARHLSVEEVAQRYDFPASSITIVPGGTVADGWILRWAVHNGATIITNDQYRDHREAFPEFDFTHKLEKAALMGDDIWLEHRPRPIPYKRSSEPEALWPSEAGKPSAQ